MQRGVVIPRRSSSFGFCASIVASLIISFIVSSVPVHAQAIEWVRQFGTTRGDTALAVAKGPSGVYVAGVTSGVFPGETPVVAGDDDQAFLSRYDEQGNVLWSREFGSSTPGDDNATGVTTDQTGVYVVGWVHDALPGQTSLGSTDAFIRKYTADGLLLWTRQFGTDAQDEALGCPVPPDSEQERTVFELDLSRAEESER